MRTNWSFAFVAFALACLQLPAQRTWRVNCIGGPNVDFPDLPAAVAAAAPGDTIWVILDPQQCAQTSPYSASVTIDKALTIVGVTSLGSPGFPDPAEVPVQGELQITGIPAGQRVSLCNLSILPWLNSANPFSHGIHATDCAGEILLEDVYYIGLGHNQSIMRFERCADVVMRGCTFELSGDPLTLTDSTMVLTNTVVGWRWPQIYPYGYTSTGPGILLRNSNATLIASAVLGASEGGPSASLAARPGARVESGTLTIGPYTSLRGGYTVQGLSNSSYYLPNPSLGQVFLDPRADPLTFSGLPYPTPITLNVTYHDWIVAGETYHIATAGPPGGWGLMAVGSAAITPVPLFGWGNLAMDPMSVQVIGLRQLDPIDGWTEWTMRCPAMVGTGHVFAFQAAVLAPNGAISLTLPSPFAVAWQHGQVP
jgi:hypothetical protein